MRSHRCSAPIQNNLHTDITRSTRLLTRIYNARKDLERCLSAGALVQTHLMKTRLMIPASWSTPVLRVPCRPFWLGSILLAITILPVLPVLSLVGLQSRCRGKQTRCRHLAIIIHVSATSVAVTPTASFAATAPGLLLQNPPRSPLGGGPRSQFLSPALLASPCSCRIHHNSSSVRSVRFPPAAL